MELDKHLQLSQYNAMLLFKHKEEECGQKTALRESRFYVYNSWSTFYFMFSF